MYEQQLNQAGLTPEQAEIYEVLLKNGPLPAGQINKKSTLKRGLIYKTLDILAEKGLVEKKEEEGKAAIFGINHPLKLKEMVEKREQRAKDAQIVLDGILPSLISDFNLVSGQPGTRFYEGVEGLRQIYDDILNTLAPGETFYLVRAAYEPVFQEKIVPIINNFIKKRVKKNISVIALTPDDNASAANNPEKDKQVLLTRILVEKNDYNAPVEINIYGNKIALLSFGKELIGTIIESPQISLALKQIFLLLQKGLSKPPSVPDSSQSHNV